MVTTWDVHDTYSDTALTNGGDKEESVVSLSGINTAPPKLEKTLASVASTSTFAPSGKNLCSYNLLTNKALHLVLSDLLTVVNDGLSTVVQSV